MADPEKSPHDTTVSPTLTPKDSAQTLDADALALASQGYTPALARNYTVLSVLAVGFSLTELLVCHLRGADHGD